VNRSGAKARSPQGQWFYINCNTAASMQLWAFSSFKSSLYGGRRGGLLYSEVNYFSTCAACHIYSRSFCVVSVHIFLCLHAAVVLNEHISVLTARDHQHESFIVPHARFAKLPPCIFCFRPNRTAIYAHYSVQQILMSFEVN